jgi:sulfite exporter TauE/SafE/copper chaperone CopZ
VNKVYIKIEGIHCDHCRSKIINNLKNIKSIKKVDINKNIAEVEYTGKLDKDKIIKTINDLDYFTKEDYITNDKKRLKSNIKLKEFLIIFTSIIIIIYLINKIFGFNIFNVIPTIDSNITYGMLFITGLLTSIHCISMCGAINLTATYNNENKINLKKPLLYNLGRIISYSLIGGFVGLIGSVISINETINGIIIILAAILMLLMSLNMLGIINIKLPHFLHIKIKPLPNNSFIIGLLNGFMPCGPLQAMQLYALSTGSFVKGFLSMFLFSIGTVPLMLCIGIIFNLFKGKRRILLNKIASVLILVLSLVMLNRGFSTLGINNNNSLNNYSDYTLSVIYDDYQEVNTNLSYGSYGDIIVQKGKKVKLIINVKQKYLTGCNETVVIKEYGIKQKLEAGENVIEFIPDKEGTFSINCWMNMIHNTIKVINDENYFEEGAK